jgi:multimeric flavodoxin WrbA
MKVVAFNGSPRKNGNTYLCIKRVFNKLEAEGIQCEIVQLTGKIKSGCTACMKCKERKDMSCAIKEDIINECIQKMVEADGIIIGSPTYFAGLTSETKALIDRAGYVAKANNNLLKRKVGAAITAVRRAGALNTLNSINAFFLISEMIVPGSFYWNLVIGKEIGDVNSDEEGMAIMDALGENMAWLLKKLKG